MQAQLSLTQQQAHTSAQESEKLAIDLEAAQTELA